MAPGATSVKLPTLPMDLDVATLRPGYGASASTSLYDLETITTWAEMRALPFWVPEIDAVQANRYGRACQSWD